MDDEDNWDLDYTEARVKKIRTAQIQELKETCKDLPDEKKRLAAGLKEIDAEFAARVAGIEANVVRRDKAERKRKRLSTRVPIQPT